MFGGSVCLLEDISLCYPIMLIRNSPLLEYLSSIRNIIYRQKVFNKVTKRETKYSQQASINTSLTPSGVCGCSKLLLEVAAHDQVLLDCFVAVLDLQNQELNYLKLQKRSWQSWLYSIFYWVHRKRTHTGDVPPDSGEAFIPTCCAEGQGSRALHHEIDERCCDRCSQHNPALRPVFSFSQAFPLLALARKNSPKLSDICSSTSGILVQVRGSLHSRRHQRKERCTPVKRWSTRSEEGNPASAVFNPKKKTTKNCVGSRSLPTSAPRLPVCFGSKDWNSWHPRGKFCTC